MALLNAAARAAAYLAAVSRLFVRVAERTGPYWRMYWQAAATDPEIAADWEATMADRRRTMDEVVSYVLSEYLHEARDLGGGLRGDHALHERGAHAALLGGARPRLREGLRDDAPAT